MSTSGVYTFTISGNDIIREAMLNIGKLGEAENPSNQEMVDCRRKLNMLVNAWKAKQDFAPGLKMWLRRHGTLFLSNSTGVYYLGPSAASSGSYWTNSPYFNTTTSVTSSAAITIYCSTTGMNVGDYVGLQLDAGSIYWTTISSISAGSYITVPSGPATQASSGNYVYSFTTQAQRPDVIETAYLRDNNGNDTPLNIGTLQDYDLLPSKMQTGYIADPTFVYYEAQLTNGVLYCDMNGAQDVTKQIHLSYMEPVQSFVNPNDSPEYPQEWYGALCWGLTKTIAPMFNVPFTKDMEEVMMSFISAAREAYSEVTTMYFAPGNQ
jgi:hypothetical protein